MTKDEALRMALDALDALYINDYNGYELGKRDAHLVDNALTAIKEALAQPKREWVDLTPADFDWLEQVFDNKVSNNFVLADIVCVISAKLKEKQND